MRYEMQAAQPAFSVKDVSVLHVSRRSYYRHSYHNGRTKHGFIYTVKGRMENEFLSETVDRISVEAGELIFIPEGCKYYGTYAESGTEIKIVQFSLESGCLPSYLSHPIKLSLPAQRELIEAFFRQEKGNASHSSYYYYSCLYRLFDEIDAAFGSLPTKYKRLGVALDEISLRFDENCSVASYAALCGMSEVSFRRLFKEYTGMSPVEYRNDLRLQNAKIKLASGEFNVSEAAASVGFSNLSFFIRLYKKKFGYTPKKE